ncbi:MAG: FG-GAP-like repeat-containing protein [Planctomycetota bacterium]
MSPQFVDYDSDGDLDIVAATFSGSPYVALRDDDGFATPQMILDRAGARIVGNQFWNYDTKKWDTTKRCNPMGTTLPETHVTSAWAVDYDRDGDLDLLLGDHSAGYVFLRVNEGSATAPAFAETNQLVNSADQPLVVPGTVTTLRTVDWNADGRFDLLIGSMGDPYSDEVGGGVTLHLDTADEGLPSFGPAITLIERSTKGQSTANRPDSGLYMDAGDMDGDGDLDLIVGGYSIYVPPARVLSGEEAANLEALRKQREVLDAELSAVQAKLREIGERQNGGNNSEEAAAASAALSTESQRLFAEVREIAKRIDELAPSRKRESLTWYYQNLRISNETPR